MPVMSPSEYMTPARLLHSSTTTLSGRTARMTRSTSSADFFEMCDVPTTNISSGSTCLSNVFTECPAPRAPPCPSCQPDKYTSSTYLQALASELPTFSTAVQSRQQEDRQSGRGKMNLCWRDFHTS
eukprot:758524-Hanusia_phi.AAC.1